VLAGWVGLSQDSAYTCSECRRVARQGVDTAPAIPPPQDSRSDASLQHEFRNGEGDKPLARARRRLGGPGRPKTTEPSRFARFRRRHPEYVARERKRLERRQKNSGQPLAQEQDAAAGSSEGTA